jgi:hypothetical protein
MEGGNYGRLTEGVELSTSIGQLSQALRPTPVTLKIQMPPPDQPLLSSIMPPCAK